MTLRIAQDYRYAGADYWTWRAWIEGTAAELKNVRLVRWFLHPSFTPSVVISRDRAGKFALDSSGWGTFQLRAELQLVDGNDLMLRHRLELDYPDDQSVQAPAKPAAVPRRGSTAPASAGGAKAPARPPGVIEAKAAEAPRKVYLSFGSEDSRRAAALRKTLETLGVKVVDDSHVDAGQPFELAVLDLMAGADATIAYVSSDVPSAFVAHEVNASAKAGKPTLVITSEDVPVPIAGLDPTVPVKRIDAGDPSGISAALDALKLK